MPTVMTDERLFERLAPVTGVVLDQPELLAEWARDWWPLSARLEIDEAELPSFAVIPDTADEVASVVKLAAIAGRSIILRGGGSNTVGALEPHAGAILIDLRGLNVIDPVDEINGTVLVDAGVFGGELEARLNEQGYTLGHYPRSLHLSTAGGWIATRASGSFSTKYGGIEDLLVGLDVVLAAGSIVRARDASMRSAGPRWIDLFVGCEGAFGIVTSATLRVRPIPEERRFRAFSVPTYDETLDAIRQLIQRGVIPAAVCLYDPAATAHFGEQFGAYDAEHLLLLAFEGPSALVEVEESLTVAAVTEAGGRDLGDGPAIAWHEQQFACDWLIDGNELEGTMADEVDVAAPWSAMATVIFTGRAALEAIAAEVWVHITHVEPIGASVTFTFFIREKTDEAALASYQQAWSALMRAVLDAGGNIVHHGGIGQARLPWLAEELGDGIKILDGLKRTFDPDRRLNPGRLSAR